VSSAAVAESRTVSASDGTAIHVDAWAPEGTPTCVVVVAHGGAEHVGRYANLAGDLGRIGAYVFGPDHRGQGRSGGVRGHVDRFETYADDLRRVMMDVRDGLPPSHRPEAVPWFLFGHSMGGLISLTALLEHADAIPLRGAILSSPLLGLTMKVPAIKRAIGKLAAVLAPKLALPAGIPDDAICRDPDVVRRYAADPHRATVVTAAWFAAMNAAIARVEHDAARLELPLLWIVGTGDLICDHHASERIFAKLPDPAAHDQTFVAFEGYYHELHNEPEELRAPVVERIVKWVEDRLKPSAS
jgi:alpha-beta hydrolase superfamily lysophospholipase